MQLITLRTFDNSVKAHLLKTKIEAEGIPCYLFDENIVTLNPLYNFATHGIKLKVNEFDAEQAHTIALEFESARHTNSNHIVIRCPKCNSSDLAADFKSFKGLKGIFSAVISAIFFVWPLNLNYRYYCRNCSNVFEENT